MAKSLKSRTKVKENFETYLIKEDNTTEAKY